jgi:putative transcriptional regulator
MTIKHTLNEQLAMGYAAGVLPEAFDVVVAAHLSLSDESRAIVSSYEAVGACLMENCERADMNPGALSSTMDRIKNSNMVVHRKKNENVLPEPVQKYFGGDIEKVKWTSLGGGVKQAVLPTDKKAQARLLYIPAGQSVPDHGHRGLELTLVLQGSFADEVDHFGRGDIEIAGDDLDHQPVAGTEADCICLTATDAPLRFNGLIPRIVQPFLKI